MYLPFSVARGLLFLVLVFSIFSLPVKADSRNALQEAADRVVYRELSNGIRVIFLRRDLAPVFTGAVTVRVGGSDEQQGQTGVSHMFEHMAFKGTETIGTHDYAKEKKLLAELEEVYSRANSDGSLSPELAEQRDAIEGKLKEVWNAGEFSREYEKRGAYGMNATTSKDVTQYFVSLPSASFEFWCWMESERLVNPVMRQFYQERDVVLEERRQRTEDSPMGKLYEKFMHVAYFEHPYRFPVIGYEADLLRLTATETDRFRKQYYVAENIVISIVGDLDAEQVLPQLERYFGRVKRLNGAIPRPTVVEPVQSGQREFVLRLPASPELMIGYHKPNYPHPDDAPLSLFWDIVAGSKVSLLHRELVQRRRLATSISYGDAPGFAYPNLMLFFATPRAPHSNREVIEAFDHLIERVLKGGVSDRELEISKRKLAVEYLGHLKSNESLALDFGNSESIYGNWKAAIDWYGELMNATSEDVLTAARKYVRERNRTIGRIEREA